MSGNESSLSDVVRGARVYDLAHPLTGSTPVSAGDPPFRMGLVKRHSDGSGVGISGANELFTLGGHTGTHIDALCHAAFDGRLYGGVDAGEASKGGRFTVLGVDSIEPFVCRGILLDVPAAAGRAALEGGDRVTADDLARTCAAQGVSVGPVDAVLVRTAWPVGRFESEELMRGTRSGVPGPDASAAQWLVEHGVRVTGADTLAYEYLAPGAGHAELPVHVSLLVEHGVYIIEMLNLEELAADRVYEFLFVAAPLKLVGATGSPLRPLAIAS